MNEFIEFLAELTSVMIFFGLTVGLWLTIFQETKYHKAIFEKEIERINQEILKVNQEICNNTKKTYTTLDILKKLGSEENERNKKSNKFNKNRKIQKKKLER